MAEGAGLLNRYTVKSRIGGSNPPLSATFIFNSFVGLDLSNNTQYQQIHPCSGLFTSVIEVVFCLVLALLDEGQNTRKMEKSDTFYPARLAN